ncbi:MAG TPA: carboxypeptidase-like regulatory domain-containing protein, partial [Puia sp.]|nr:carboxypeptidase-like regulatory domain-containing protein [Puia sp.]
PFPLLDVAPGNELHYYNQYAFSLLNKWEYIHDRYLGVNFEHNFGNGLFRFIPLTRKLKFRQFWTAKALWGSLSDANKSLNHFSDPGSGFHSLDGKTYLELGTGVDNIFRFFRVDMIWRVLPRPLPTVPAERFGVFGSFRLAF